MDLKQMRDKIKLDADILEDEMFSNARLNEMINEANRAIQIKLNGLGLSKWEKSSSPSVTNTTWAGYNVCYVSVPTDLLEGDNVINAQTLSGSTYGYATQINESKFYERLKNTYLIPTYKYPVMVRLDSKLYFFPRFTSITLTYRQVAPTLSGDTDTTIVPLEYHDLIVDKVVLEIKKIKNHGGYVNETNKLNQEIEDTYVKSMRNKQEVINDAK